MSDDSDDVVQQIFRPHQSEVDAFKAAAAACGLPLGQWYVQAARVQAGLPTFEPTRKRLNKAPQRDALLAGEAIDFGKGRRSSKGAKP